MNNEFHRVPTGALQCAHQATNTVPMPVDSRHYAQLRCATCGAFLKFPPRPENVERRKLTGFKLTKLQMYPGLNPWERQFIDSLAKQDNKLSPKQQDVLDRICVTYLKGGAQ